jgi:ribonuclease G
MIDEILINDGLLETRVALIADGRVREVLIESPGRSGVVGDIFLGRVDRVAPGLDAAFVNVGLARDGFLPAREAVLAPRARAEDRAPKINRCVHEGEALLVQVTKDPLADKGARLTTKLTLPGRYLIYTPGQTRIALSRRIGDEAERARIDEIMEGVAGPDEGFVVRTVAVGASAEALEAEAEGLRAQWAGVAMGRDEAPAPACVHEELGAVARTLRDHADEGVQRVRLDSAEALAEAKRYCGDFLPGFEERLELFTGPDALFDLYDAEAELEAALEPRVALPSGGHIVIESTEALTAIDVNSGSHVDSPNRHEVALRTNLEAAVEAARQVALRAIGGLIVIDFIQLQSRAEMDQVMVALKEALAGDRAPVRVAGPSAFGLAEITRRRLRDPLVRALTEPCAHCAGGRVRKVEAVAAEVVRRAEREAAAAPGRALVLTAAPEVVDYLGAEEGELVAALEARLGARVTLSSDETMPRTSFQVHAEA